MSVALRGLASAAAFAAFAHVAHAQDATWIGGSGTDFSTNANWVPANAPGSGDTAFFDASVFNTVTVSGFTVVGGFTLNAGASAYTTTVTSDLFFDGTGVVINGGSLAITVSGVGTLNFAGASTAGTATIINNSVNPVFAGINFLNTSSAANAHITNNGGMAFFDTSRAGAATIINNGVLQFQNGSTAESATITTNNGAITQFFNTSSGGTAAFVVNAGGIVDFSTLASAGTTVGSIEGGGTIDLGAKQLEVGALGTDTVFSGAITGAGGGSLVKAGGGSLTLSGISTYTGPTTVNAGTLVVDGTIISDVTVNGGTLAGIGQVGNTVIGAGGTHAPGSLVAAQTVNGTYQNSGTLRVQVNDAGQSSLLIVTGGVNITGATLQILEVPGSYVALHHQYLIIRNDGVAPVVGTFGTITNTLAFLTPSVVTDGGDGNDVVLTLTRNDVQFAAVALTPNQRAVAGALQNGFNTSVGSDGETVVNAILGLSAAGARNAFDLMSGEIHASIAHVLLGQSRHLTSMASERLWDLATGGGTASAPGFAMMGLGLAPGDLHERMALGGGLKDSVEPSPRRGSLGAWVRGYGDVSRVDDDGNAAQLDSRTGGIMAGFDVPLAFGVRAGVMGGWSTSDADVDRRLSSAEVTTGHVAAYASAEVGQLLLKGVAGYSWQDIDVDRHIAFGGLSRDAHSSYGADVATVYGEAGWRLRLGGIGVMPMAALLYAHAEVDGFTETGAGALNLSSNGASFDALDVITGVRFGTTLGVSGGVTWMPQARVLWTHSFGDVDPRLDLALAGGGAFVVAGATRGRDVLTLGVGLNAAMGETLSAFVDYAAHLSEGGEDHTGTAGLRVRF